MGNVHMEATQINYRGGATKMNVEDAIKSAIELTPEQKTNINKIPTIEAAVATKTDHAVIAPEFDAESGIYAIGDLVMHEGKLYEFTSAHETAGEWNSTEVSEKTVADEVESLMSGLTDITDVTATVNSELIDNPSLATIYAKKQGKLLFVSAYINPRTSGGVDVASNTTIFTLSGVTLLMEVFCSSNSSNGNPTRLKLGTNGVIKNENPMKNAEWYSMSFVGLIN